MPRIFSAHFVDLLLMLASAPEGVTIEQAHQELQRHEPDLLQKSVGQKLRTLVQEGRLVQAWAAEYRKDQPRSRYFGTRAQAAACSAVVLDRTQVKCVHGMAAERVQAADHEQRVKLVVSHLTASPGASTGQLQSLLELSPDQATRVLKRMVMDKQICNNGSCKPRRWYAGEKCPAEDTIGVARQQLLDLAKRREGVTPSETAQPKFALRLGRYMAARGKLFASLLGDPAVPPRFFASLADCEAYRKRTREQVDAARAAHRQSRADAAELARQQREAKRKAAAEERATQRAAAKAAIRLCSETPVVKVPRHFAAPPSGEVIVPADVKVTRCPSPAYDYRYQVAPNLPVFGAGFSAVGLGRDVRTGRSWDATPSTTKAEGAHA